LVVIFVKLKIASSEPCRFGGGQELFYAKFQMSKICDLEIKFLLKKIRKNSCSNKNSNKKILQNSVDSQHPS
jgi:hypothetical protein